MGRRVTRLVIASIGVLFFNTSITNGQSIHASIANFTKQNCIRCHDESTQSGGLDLSLVLNDVAALNNDRRDVWERVVRKLRTRQMPPVGEPRPEAAAYQRVQRDLESMLERWAKQNIDAGRTETLRRLTRFEYQNAIRDILHLDIDVSQWLPPDESSHGFDNITVGELSPTLLNRYVGAAEKVSRLAMGGLEPTTGGHTYRVPADRTQEKHVAGLPLGTRGGTLITHTFPRDGEYEIQVTLARDRNENVEGLRGVHTLEVLMDRRREAQFKITRPSDQNHSLVDAHLRKRFRVTAGPHQVGVTFLRKSESLLETKRQPYDAHYNFHRHPRLSPAVFQVSITGPFGDSQPGATPSRRRLGVDVAPHDAQGDATQAAAEASKILSPLLRRAYRRPVNDDDMDRALAFFRSGWEAEGFERGIELALTSVLVSPHFLFRVERDPTAARGGESYPLSDLEIASRLSFFLWSSIPDDELLAAAVAGQLSDPDELERQVRRMLLDKRSSALVKSFAAQWLDLRALDALTPNLRLFPDFDDNLRHAFRRETELFVESVFGEDQSVLKLLSADYTFLNERLARHYKIPHIYGSRFRRVDFSSNSSPATRRGGLLRHGSILAVTSYATRTSPVIRGNWVLENLIGAPAPPPPANVPDLKDNVVGAELPVRQRLAMHRAQEACAGCHNLMDPIGFALENYDAVGRWRDSELGLAVDSRGGLPDGAEFRGVVGLEESLLKQPEWLATTITEKLLTYAIGRGLEPFDGVAVRKIVQGAAKSEYQFSTLILGIAESVPFQMRRAE